MDESEISSSSSELPTEVTEEILSRLPVKSLMRFRCVSKPWKFLFTDAGFIVKHLKRSTGKNPYDPTHMLEEKLGSLYSSKIESCFSTTTSTTSTTSTDRKMKEELGEEQQLLVKELGFECIKLKASCDGLVCLSFRMSRNTYGFREGLLNPATREFLLLPQHKEGSDNQFPNPYYGLGVDPITNEYKVVRITDHFFTPSVTVYTVSDDSHEWRHICHPFPHEIRVAGHEPSICVGGFVHWMAFRRRGEDHEDDGMGPYVIVSFDLHEEVFQEMPQLPFNQLDTWLCLGYLGGCLTVSTSFPLLGMDSIELWVMKEYGVRESWTKVFKMKSCLLETINLSFVYSRGFFKDGQEILLMAAASQLLTDPTLYNPAETQMLTGPILYNPETQKMTKMKSSRPYRCDDRHSNVYSFATFVETLVSLRPKGKKKRKRSQGEATPTN